MSAYSPKQRIVPVHILSSLGWLSAKVHVGEVNFFLDALNSIPYFLRLSEVVFENGRKLPFFGLQRHGTHIVIPHDDLELVARANPAEREVKRVGCLLTSGNIEGDLRLLPEVRVSDYMAKCSSYFPLFQTTGSIWKEEDRPRKRFADAPVALINSEAIVGITER